jgi:two-component system, chemotaxis family, sensor kinase CheA
MLAENLLTRLRDGQLTLNPDITTALLGMVDAVRQMLKEVQATGRDGDADYPELRKTLTRLQNCGASSSAQASVLPASPVGADLVVAATELPQRCQKEGQRHFPTQASTGRRGCSDRE